MIINIVIDMCFDETVLYAVSVDVDISSVILCNYLFDEIIYYYT